MTTIFSDLGSRGVFDVGQEGSFGPCSSDTMKLLSNVVVGILTDGMCENLLRCRSVAGKIYSITCYTDPLWRVEIRELLSILSIAIHRHPHTISNYEFIIL